MTTLRQALAEHDDELLFADGFDEAIVGVVERAGQEPYVLYDARRCIALLQREGGTYEEAADHFSHNVLSAWVGERTPGYVWTRRQDAANGSAALAKDYVESLGDEDPEDEDEDEDEDLDDEEPAEDEDDQESDDDDLDDE